VAVTFQLTLNYPGSLYNALYADLAQAAVDWAQYLNSNATIRVQVDVGSFPSNLGFVVQNDSNDFVQVGTTGSGQELVEPWGEYALQNNASVAGSPYDIHIYFNVNTNPDGAQVYINPNPAAGGPVPAGEYDATTMFLKALGYGLGFAAMTTTNARPPASEVTPLDQYVQLNPSGPTGTSLSVDDIGKYQLVGSAVEAVNGGAVPLVTPEAGYQEATVHIGNTPTISGAADIMAVTQDIAGQSLRISTLDLAIMQQAGVPIIPGIVPCFAAGTRIVTPRGAVLIERLHVGDTVLTLAGRAQPIRWIGRRQVDCRRHPRPGEVLPIRVAAHAFGVGRPRRPVLLSPDHAVFVEGVLIPVKLLANLDTVTQAAVDTVVYLHIELPRHDVVFADGLPVESYLKVDDRDLFDNGDGVIELHPNLMPDASKAALVWEARGCAPLLRSGWQVARTRAKLQVQAGLLSERRETGPRGRAA
jgi:hypothetical protein